LGLLGNGDVFFDVITDMRLFHYKGFVYDLIVEDTERFGTATGIFVHNTGPTEEDVVLNLSPNVLRPRGRWKQILWDPNTMYIAKWNDRLSGKIKYVWLASSSPPKQISDHQKFEKAKELTRSIQEVRKSILKSLSDPDLQTRKIATVAYIIDAVNMRVGDEKDPDEARTVGATTLKAQNITVRSDGRVLFDFYGKGAVKWHREMGLPDAAVKNLKEFSERSREELFEGVNSKMVNKFLEQIMPGLTAKVFRTFHATETVAESLAKSGQSKKQPDYLKKHAMVMANLEAAKVCNHKREIPRGWAAQIEKKKQRLKKLRAKKTPKAREAARKLALRIKEMKLVMDYNLRTSLKSYIDPRTFIAWCEENGYDWREFYPEILQKRFSWVQDPKMLEEWKKATEHGKTQR
jgi:DNA topoisomerase-1